jgi:hypothetical protein
MIDPSNFCARMATTVAEAEGRILRALATTHIKDSGNWGDKFDRLHIAARMGIVAPRLRGTQATAAPAIPLALGYFDGIRAGL